MCIDISNIAVDNYKYAKHLATLDGVIKCNKSLFELGDAKEISPYKSVDFWRNIALSAELLLKASLLKHHVNFFHKRSSAEYGPKVTASTNRWLSEILKELGIFYIAQINTGTITTALKHASEELFTRSWVDKEKAKLIEEMIYIIVRTRRNRNTHFYFPNQSYIDISELEMIYIPLLNLLAEIYEKDYTINL